MKMFARCGCRDCRMLIPYEAEDGTPTHVPTLCENCAKAHCSSKGGADCCVRWEAPEVSLVEMQAPVDFGSPIPLTITKAKLEEQIQSQLETYSEMVRSVDALPGTSEHCADSLGYMHHCKRSTAFVDVVTDEEAEALGKAYAETVGKHHQAKERAVRRFLVGAAFFLLAIAGFIVWLCP